MLAFIIEVLARLEDNSTAIGILAAGPLEDLLGGDDAVMRRAEDEARINPRFRAALARVVGVKYNEPGFEVLHSLVGRELLP
jgi:hypothetical protein